MLIASLNIIEQILKGGVIAYAIVALSLLLLTLTILYFSQLRAATQCPEELQLEVLERVRQERWSEASELLASDPSRLAHVLEALLARRGAGETRLREVLADAVAEAITEFDQRVAYIGLIAAIAPMLGLLGTVSGMIQAFATMSSAAATPEATELAGAISEALITTYLGLLVAMPALVLHLVLRHRVNHLGLRLGDMGEQLVAHLAATNGGTRRSRPAGGAAPVASRRVRSQP